MSRGGWTAGDEARLKRFANIAAKAHRLNLEAGGNLFGLQEPVNMPADAQAIYDAANARHRAKFGEHPGIAPHARSAVATAAGEYADQIIRARHRARFGTETAK